MNIGSDLNLIAVIAIILIIIHSVKAGIGWMENKIPAASILSVILSLMLIFTFAELKGWY